MASLLGLGTPASGPSVGQGMAPGQDNFVNNLVKKNNTDGFFLTSHQTVLPWNSSSGKVGSAFFEAIKVDPGRWDQLYPYRLMVIDVTDGNKVVRGGKDDLKVTVTKGTGANIVNLERLVDKWIITLPISPQQLNITDQFAINTSATLRGILEEHNGVRFKNITATGSFGVWPYRKSVTNPPTSPTILESLFGGTLEAVGSLVDQATKVYNTAVNGSPNSKPKVQRPVNDELLSTGYFFAIAVQQFIEQYAEAKKDPKNAGWRLVFDMPKQNQSFIVTPVTYTWQQSASNSQEFKYNMAFKAWRRIYLDRPDTVEVENNQQITPGILQRITNTLDAARNTMSSALNLIGAVTSDLEAPLNILRQFSLLVKDLGGVALAVADLPTQLQKDYSSSIKQSIGILSTSFQSQTSDPAVLAAVAAVVASAALAEGLPSAAVASGQIGAPAAALQTVDPAALIFQNPNANYALMSLVPVNTLNLNQAQQAQVQKAIDQVRALNIAELQQYRGQILNLALALTNSFGAGDAYFSKVYNRPAPTTRLQPMTVDEFNIVAKLYEVIQAFDIMTANTTLDDQKTLGTMDFIAGLAADSNIAFNVPTSKILAPVPFGLSIEQIAQRYLGDAQRWLEIVTLNYLREPYIDENGFTYPLLSNGSGRQITIASNANLFEGQRVILKSTTQQPLVKTILNIERLSDTSYLITLDGLANVGTYTTADSAYLQAYLPGTVNSQQKIYIPSDRPTPNTSSVIVPSVAAQDPLTGLSMVDLLLTDSGDVAVNNYGDFRYSYGLTNIIQALKIKFGTKQGTVLLHPEFGLDVSPGSANSDFDAQKIYNSISNMISNDQRFDGINSMQISLDGPVLNIGVEVALAGNTGTLPLSFKVSG